MKKIIAVVLAAFLVAAPLAGCSAGKTPVEIVKMSQENVPDQEVTFTGYVTFANKEMAIVSQNPMDKTETGDPTVICYFTGDESNDLKMGDKATVEGTLWAMESEGNAAMVYDCSVK